MEPIEDILSAEEKLRSYCESVDFKGWDPWDALASPLFHRFPFNRRLPRWAANHAVKISPLNLRPLLAIRPDCFAKGLALFLSGYVLRERRRPSPHQREIIQELYRRLMQKTIPGYSGPCWGTNVPYQTRAFFVPAQTPSLVHTAFAVEALLDLNEFTPRDHFVEVALGACRFALQDLSIRTTAGDGICFSYTPVDQSRVINVTALAARMLARAASAAQDSLLREKARLAVNYVVSQQAADGSWRYGEEPVHHWIDNYHTGFVLDALEDYSHLTGDESVAENIRRGVQFYRNHLFREDGVPKFSPHSIYPIDGHCLAQGILTFCKQSRRDPALLPFAQKIARWGINHFSHPRGYFYFQKRRFWFNRIPHIRWVNAWMFLALNRLIAAVDER
jgi:hypothetical protein